MNRPLYDTIPLTIQGKEYKIKCPEGKMDDLMESAHYFEAKLREMAQTDTPLSLDKLFMITTLNALHGLLSEKKQLTENTLSAIQKIEMLKNKIDLLLNPL